ncbi:hypothetical protein AGLY_000115 [Aphis glycines]|uniref:Uncharacterized protein n=1 Tax=Aphis glycines TaxID=307491 RepID=A0A6G0U674_APHGL|nr:hypothetical protein AGLY_000115 [Aphis glycines]
MSLLHTTERDNESQRHNAHSSSVWPRTAGLKPIDREPIKIQLRVDPTSNCDPRPSDTVRIPPKCSAIYLTCASYPVGCIEVSNWISLPSLPPPVIMLPSFNTQMENTDPSCTFRATFRILFYSPRPQMTTDPFESPDKMSPFCVNAKHVTYLGRSRVVSNIPLRLYRVPPASSVQKLMWPLPQVTIWFRSSGLRDLMTLFVLLPVPHRYVMIVSLVDGTQKTATVLSKTKHATATEATKYTISPVGNKYKLERQSFPLKKGYTQSSFSLDEGAVATLVMS